MLVVAAPVVVLHVRQSARKANRSRQRGDMKRRTIPGTDLSKVATLHFIHRLHRDHDSGLFHPFVDAAAETDQGVLVHADIHGCEGFVVRVRVEKVDSAGVYGGR